MEALGPADDQCESMEQGSQENAPKRDAKKIRPGEEDVAEQQYQAKREKARWSAFWTSPRLPDKQAFGGGKFMACQLLLGGLVKAKPLEQADRSLVLGFDGSEKSRHAVGAGNVLEDGLGSLSGVAPTPMPGGEHVPDPGGSG